MQNIFDYLNENGCLSPKEVPFGEVDFAIFAMLSYCPFEMARLNLSGRKLGEINRNVFVNYKPQSSWDWYKSTFKLWEKLPVYSRFANAYLGRFVYVINDDTVDDLDKQFAAITFVLNDVAIVTFRGTDLSIIGWRENFTLGYSDSIPSQTDAAQYLNEETQKYRRVFVCGHSKGGNLAMYAAAHCERKDCIAEVYNFDGPGLSDDEIAREGWKEIQDRVHVLVPEKSVVGLLFGCGALRHVVASEGLGIMQHDLTTWQVIGMDFVLADRLSSSSVSLKKALDEFIAQTTEEERKTFVYVFFNMIAASGAYTIDLLPYAIIRNIPRILKSNANLSKKEKQLLSRVRAAMVRNGIEAISTREEYDIPTV